MGTSIAIDLDTTLNTLNTDWLKLYNEDFNDNLTNECITDWNIAKFTKPECGKLIYDYLKIPGFFRNLGVQPHAQEVTEWMAKEFDLCIATAYVPEACMDKCRWVDEHFPHIGSGKVIFINDKSKLNADYLIDDGGHNIEAFKGIGMVFDQPYNRYLENKLRVTDWRDIGRYFRG
jgi:5'-nucleotidase